MRIAVVDPSRCRPDKCGHICATVCPVNKTSPQPAIVIEKRAVISEELCIGCGICVKKCPFNAITIVNLPDEYGTPVHQYGPNLFRLYGLPYPKEGGVVGIVGPNGVGKTTAVKILAGQIVPNLGRFDGVTYADVIRHFRGTELQSYFEKLARRGVRLVHKPQEVEKIRSFFKGKVRELLSPRAQEILKEMEGGYLLDRNVPDLSGGELQKVAIAAALAKEGDFYFFDEPTSFLDIKERVRIAQFIKRLSGSVLVVDHDLAVLDYMSDYVFVVYGVPSAYGRFSGIKGVREGINQYLLGFLKEENVRIREHEITFFARAKEGAGRPKGSYPSFSVRRGDFSLEVEGGEIREGEVIGIAGPNGIGKTTFVLSLLGNFGGPRIADSISYKPQYVELPHVPVSEILKGVNEDILRGEILGPLELEKLLNLTGPQLSGGERQRVAVAKCLATDAEIYLLDEPSAYLDVEQRVRLSRVIPRVIAKRKAVAFVVDHDVAFLDAISDRIIVFDGVPGRRGHASPPLPKEEGMNRLLKLLDITIRKDPHTGRPRINKPGSQKDREQRRKGRYYE